MHIVGVARKPVPFVQEWTINAVGVAAATTTFASPFVSFVTTEALRQLAVSSARRYSTLAIRMTTAQPGDGALVLTLRKNGVDVALLLTIAAGSAAGVYSVETGTADYALSDLLSLKLVNASPTTASGSIASFALAGTM